VDRRVVEAAAAAVEAGSWFHSLSPRQRGEGWGEGLYSGATSPEYFTGVAPTTVPIVAESLT
jgi:hypothetical protein